MRDLVRHRFLFEQLVRRELRRKYQGSVLGVAWYLVNPLVLLGAYYLMFGVVFQVAEHDDYPLFLVVGLVVWVFFSQSVLGAAPSLLDHGALIRKARFPRETIPAATVTVQLVIFCVVLAIVTAICAAVRGADPALLLLPALVVALWLFTTGLALCVAVTHAYLRDVAPILGAILLPWFFLSPIFFEPSDITGDDLVRELLTWANPVAPFITAVRDVVYAGEVPTAGTLGYVAVAAAVAGAAGLALFRRLQAELAVVV